MLSRFPAMRAYMGPEFIGLLSYIIDTRAAIKDSIDLASQWQGFNDSVAAATGHGVMPTVTLENHRR